MERTRLFHRDFTMVVAGQIISLFGNAILRYALPIYLLNQTHSEALFGLVSACAFLPMVLFAPVGGIVADRVNKRNVMVALDFTTAAIMAVYTLIREQASLVAPLVVVLMLLYGIQGAYQPAVQSSLPALAPPEELNSANAVINMVNSLSGLVGPVLGGVVYAAFGIQPILMISIVCFFCSAVMEIFIRIPFEKRENTQGVFALAAADLRESFRFITREKPVIGKVGLLACAINLVFSALIVIGLPVLVTEHLGFSQALGNRLYGFASGALALGGLLGGLIAGAAGEKLRIHKSYWLIFFCTLTLLPLALAVALPKAPFASYGVIVLCCVVMMIFSTIFAIEIMAFVQRVTPGAILGKVMALLGCLFTCAHPVGQAAYGFIFEKCAGALPLVFLCAFALCAGLTLIARKIISGLVEG